MLCLKVILNTYHHFKPFKDDNAAKRTRVCPPPELASQHADLSSASNSSYSCYSAFLHLNNLSVGCRRWSGPWGDSPHRREARSCTLPQCACSPGGLQRKDHMLMAELWFTPHSTGEHYQAYSLSPSGAIEMDLSSMSEDICAEGDETPLSSSRFACVKVLVISS